jgi:hypothetical protein
MVSMEQDVGVPDSNAATRTLSDMFESTLQKLPNRNPGWTNSSQLMKCVVDSTHKKRSNTNEVAGLCAPCDSLLAYRIYC